MGNLKGYPSHVHFGALPNGAKFAVTAMEWSFHQFWVKVDATHAVRVNDEGTFTQRASKVRPTMAVLPAPEPR